MRSVNFIFLDFKFERGGAFIFLPGCVIHLLALNSSDVFSLGGNSGLEVGGGGGCGSFFHQALVPATLGETCLHIFIYFLSISKLR